MKSLKEIQKIVAQFNVRPGPEMRSKVLDEALVIRRNQNDRRRPDVKLNKWSTIMRSPMAKLAVAATVIIACAIDLSLWRGTQSGVALADVLTRIEQVTAYKYKMHWTETKQQTTSEVTSTVLVSQDNGIKMIQTRVDPNSGESRNDEIYLLPRENTLLIVLHQEKNFYRIKWEDAEEDYYKEKYNNPHTIIKEILNCRHISLGQSVIDGSMVEGFQTTDLTYKGGFFGRSDMIVGGLEKVNVKLWVNVETFLPIRFEEDIITKGGMHTHEVSYDFRWNVVVNADDFKPNIAEDYNSPQGEWNIPANNEENAIKGLGIFADYAGNYPAVLDSDTLKEEVKKYLESGHDSYEELSEDEKTKYNSELFTMLMSVAFYSDLIEENKNPVYYGETITPKDTNKVLMRWKISNNEYRIIYGDLHAETVSPEKLAELEKDLIK
jgi:hypothetical protein